MPSDDTTAIIRVPAPEPDREDVPEGCRKMVKQHDKMLNFLGERAQITYVHGRMSNIKLNWVIAIGVTLGAAALSMIGVMINKLPAGHKEPQAAKVVTNP